MISALTPEYLAVSPGVGAFVTFFVLAIAMALLMLNMSRHLRKIDHRRIEAEVRAEFAAEQAAAAKAEDDEAEQPPAEDAAEDAGAADVPTSDAESQDA